MNRSILFGTLLALSSAHCGSGASSTGTQDTDSDAGSSTSQIDTDGGGADACTAMGTIDDPDDNGVDANCDGADGIVGSDVYVSDATGLDTNVGTPTAPLGSLSAAITLAVTRHGRVLVAGGSYAGAGFNTPGTWAVFGGYAATYRGPPARASTTVTGDQTGVLIDGAITASIAHLTIQGASATDAMSPASHALRVHAQSVTLDDVALIAGNGFAMSAGTSPPPSTAAASSCPSAAASPWPQGTDGAWSPATAPIQGKTGESGAPGKSASGTLAITSELATVASDAATGGSDATIGGEGGNGAGGLVTTYMGAPAPYLLLWGGGGGKGGCPGVPGGPGPSGGSSVALLVVGGTVTLTRSAIQTGLGGAGGDGGAGGAGGGSPGGAPSVAQGSVPGLAISASCTPATDEFSMNCVEYGAAGGAGGTGGHGGAGAGGWTVGILSAAGVTVSADAATTFSLGRAGSGGSAGDGGSGPPGRQQSKYTIGQ
jgi:hypothetical protein